MATLTFFVMVLSLLALAAGLILLPFKRFRLRAKRAAIASGAVFLIGFVVFALQRESDNSARQLGFANASDQQKAKEAGILNAAAWQERQRLAEETKVKEKQAQEDQQRLAEEAKVKENQAHEASRAKEKQAQEDQQRAQAAQRQALLKPPVEQDRFVQAVEKARAAYKAGQTDLQRGAARPARAKDLCAALSSSELKQWVGKIARLTTNGSGDGVLVVEISKGVQLMTMNNSLSDSEYGTLIRSGSPLYQKLLEMKEGIFVRFDAGLFLSSDDCYKETSLTMKGALEEPEFVTNFRAVTRVDLPGQ